MRLCCGLWSRILLCQLFHRYGFDSKTLLFNCVKVVPKIIIRHKVFNDLLVHNCKRLFVLTFLLVLKVRVLIEIKRILSTIHQKGYPVEFDSFIFSSNLSLSLALCMFMCERVCVSECVCVFECVCLHECEKE